MKFRTEIPFSKESKNLIDHTSQVLLLGSCFVENIGKKLSYFKFPSLVNPYGILFHPLAIEQFITDVVNKKEYTEQDIFFFNEQWHTFQAHSKLSNPSKEELLNCLNSKIHQASKLLCNTTHVVITLGTSWVYRYIENDTIVANCHKLPQNKFLKELLLVQEIQESLEAIISLIKTINSKVSFIFTVSPVRHLKDGFIENQRSKAHLISAIHKLIESYNYNYIYYFPSYEIMMDELRDYRFYAEDMIHPNQTAIDFIWEKFQTAWINDSSKPIMKEVDVIQKGLAHKPFNSDSEAHQNFLKDLKLKQEELQEKLPNIQF